MVSLLVLLAAAPGSSVELVFTGDVIPHDAVKEQARAHRGWDWLFEEVAPAFRAADLAVVNLETPLTTAKKPYTGPFIFGAPPELATALAAAGADVATFANNHARDQHLAGIDETRKHLAAAGVQTVGAAGNAADAYEPLRVEKNGVSVCFMAFTRTLNKFVNRPDQKQPHVPIVDYAAEKAGGISEGEWLKKVSAVAATCDALIITPHWGDEYVQQPRPADRALARAMLDAGAVAVVGNHPHVLQPVEMYGDKVIAYSLGNLISAQGTSEDDPRRQSMLLLLKLQVAESGISVTASAQPVFTVGCRPVLADGVVAKAKSKKQRDAATARRQTILDNLPSALTASR